MYKIINILKQIEIGGKMIIFRGKIIAFWGQGFHFFFGGDKVFIESVNLFGALLFTIFSIISVTRIPV